MVKYGLAKTEIGVRFSMAAQIILMSFIKFKKIPTKQGFYENVDNHVGNVYKGHNKILSFRQILAKTACKISIFL